MQMYWGTCQTLSLKPIGSIKRGLLFLYLCAVRLDKLAAQYSQPEQDVLLETCLRTSCLLIINIYLAPAK